MRPYILAESNWKTLKDATCDLAILPWGATEAHNFHLPYATDIIEAENLAAESARIAFEKGAKVMVLPTIPFGVNTGQSDIFLDMNINPSTQLAILDDLITVLNRQGVKKLMIFNSHGGNDFKTMLRELGLKFPEMFLCMTNWYKSVNRDEYFEEPGDHADEMETSMILHLAPELVLPKETWGSGTERKNKIKAFRDGWVWAERPWSTVSPDTGVGDPSKSSKEKGAKFYKAVTEKIGNLMHELSIADISDLYE